jgi:hypothetical protein
MNKNTKIILYTVGTIGALGLTYYIWNKGKKEDTPEGDVSEGEDTKQATTPTNTFVDKVMQMQRLLGIAEADIIAAKGNVGNKTKAALTELGLTTTITSSNIDSVIAQIKTKQAQAKTDADKKQETAEKQVLVNARVGKAKEIVGVLAKKKELTWIDDTANLTTYRKDLLGKLVKKSQKVVKNNQILRVLNWKVRKDGFIEVDLGTEGYVIVSPYSVTVF